jgi:hypothetical protein
MKFFRTLIRGSFSFRALHVFKKGLFVGDDPLLIIDLFLVLDQPFSSDSDLLVLDLLDDEIAHE